MQILNLLECRLSPPATPWASGEYPLPSIVIGTFQCSFDILRLRGLLDDIDLVLQNSQNGLLVLDDGLHLCRGVLAKLVNSGRGLIQSVALFIGVENSTLFKPLVVTLAVVAQLYFLLSHGYLHG